MKLIFRGHDDRYAVEQSLLAFFPEERPVYEPAEDGEDHALVTLSRSPRYNTAVTTITYHGRTARGISRTAVDPQLTEYEAERLRQKAVKLSFFKAAREITGITPSWGALTGIRPGKLASRMLEEGMTERQVERVLRDTYFVSPESQGGAEAGGYLPVCWHPLLSHPLRLLQLCVPVRGADAGTGGAVSGGAAPGDHRRRPNGAGDGAAHQIFLHGGRYSHHALCRSDGPAADPPESQLRSDGLRGILH